MEIFTKNSAKCTISQSTNCNNFSSLMLFIKIFDDIMLFLALSYARHNHQPDPVSTQIFRRRLGARGDRDVTFLMLKELASLAVYLFLHLCR
jgi:hypothetical protein